MSFDPYHVDHSYILLDVGTADEMRSPGCCTIPSTPELQFNFNDKAAPGFAGVPTAYVNQTEAEFVLRFQLISAEDWTGDNSYYVFVDRLLKPPDAVNPASRAIYHPALAAIGIRNVKILKVSAYRPSENNDGSHYFTVAMKQVLPATKKKVATQITKTPEAKDRPETAEQRQIADNAARIEQLNSEYERLGKVDGSQ